MSTKTDLAKEIIGKKMPFYSKIYKTFYKGTEITEICIETPEDAAFLEKPQGSYFTIEADSVKDPFGDMEKEAKALAFVLSPFLKGKKRVLAAGVGNSFLTADSLGPLFAANLFCGSFFEKSLFSLTLGVEGRTAVPPFLLLKAAVKELEPDIIVAADALAAEELSEICKTVQITDAGIVPGSGIGAKTAAFSKETLGVPVIAIGTPTVIRYPGEDAAFVFPKDGDIFIERAAKLLALGLSAAVFPEFGAETIKRVML